MDLAKLSYPYQSNQVIPEITTTTASHTNTPAKTEERSRNTIKQDSPPKRGRKSASPEKSDVQTGMTGVRRSARVSNKNIDYNESDDISPSRGVSPGESDVSGFAPSEKSDSSKSPDRAERPIKRAIPSLQRQTSGALDANTRARLTSIGSKFRDHQERLQRGTPSASGLVDYSTPSLPSHGSFEGQFGPRLIPKNPYQIPASLESSQNRPPTRYGPPAQPSKAYTGYGIPPQQPPSMPNFLPNEPAQSLGQAREGKSSLNSTVSQNSGNSPSHPYPYAASSLGQLPMGALMQNGATPTAGGLSYFSNNAQFAPPVRGQSMTTQTMNIGTSQHYNTKTRPPYEQLQRSFSATADLTAPTNPIPTHPNTDPKKRKQPASSPLQPNRKRPRLSFPGDELSSQAINGLQANSRMGLVHSSPNRPFTRPNAPSDLPNTQLNEVKPTPAPFFAPKAMMYNPSMHENPAGGAQNSMAVPGGFPVDAEEFKENGADIDWGLVDFDDVDEDLPIC